MGNIVLKYLWIRRNGAMNIHCEHQLFGRQHVCVPCLCMTLIRCAHLVLIRGMTCPQVRKRPCEVVGKIFSWHFNPRPAACPKMKRIPHPDATSSPANKMLKHAKTKAILHGLLRLKAEIQNPIKCMEDSRLELETHGRWVRSYGSCNGWPAGWCRTGTSALWDAYSALLKGDASKTSSILWITLYIYTH